MSVSHVLEISEDLLTGYGVGDVYKKYADVYAQTPHVKRYDTPDYPTGLINDTLYAHLDRLPTRLLELHNQNPLLFRDLDMTLILRLLELHDLPETVVGDVIAVDVDNGTKQKPDDTEVAREMFDAEDFELYLDFVAAENFLAGRLDQASKVPSTEAVVAKLIDIYDGNVYFNECFAWYVKRYHRMDGYALPPQSASDYPFEQHARFQKVIASIEDEDGEESELKELMTYLTDSALRDIRAVWKGVPMQKIPDMVRVHLDV